MELLISSYMRKKTLSPVRQHQQKSFAIKGDKVSSKQETVALPTYSSIAKQISIK